MQYNTDTIRIVTNSNTLHCQLHFEGLLLTTKTSLLEKKVPDVWCEHGPKQQVNLCETDLLFDRIITLY